MPSSLDIKKGQRFGRLRVRREIAQVDRRRVFELRCDCGNIVTRKLIDLTTGHVSSCGCLRLEAITNLRRTHGLAGTPEHKTWMGMRKRCLNKNSKSYPDYGGRGISICKRWERFENFLVDMGKRPSSAHEIDRINNDGNYEPRNCRWVIRSVHARNRRKLRGTISKFRGVDHWKNKRWRARIVIDGILQHLGMFDSEKDAARAYDAAASKHEGFRLNFPKQRRRKHD